MIVLYNPHVDDFLAEPPHFRLVKRRPLKKYGFFVQQSLRIDGCIAVLIDATISAFVPESIFGRLPRPIRVAIAEIEYRMWLRVNGIPASSVVRVSPKDGDSNSVLLAFSYKAATGPFQMRIDTFNRFKAVVFHLSHYFVATEEKSRNMASVPNALLAGDSSIEDNEYFKRFFGWYRREVLVLPFAIAERFERRAGNAARDRRCVATGSFHDLTREVPAAKYADFIAATGSTTYHPLRKEIHERARELAEWIDSRVSPYRAESRASRLGDLLAHFRVAQKSYFAIDIVELYNRYQYAVVGEELSGFPALGAFEAMACGAVMLGAQPYYKGLGLVPGIHFVPHSGSADDVVRIVQKGAARVDGRAIEELVASMRPEESYRRWRATLGAVARERRPQERAA